MERDYHVDEVASAREASPLSGDYSEENGYVEMNCPCCGAIIPTHRITGGVAECPRTRCRRRFTPGGDGGA